MFQIFMTMTRRLTLLNSCPLNRELDKPVLMLHSRSDIILDLGMVYVQFFRFKNLTLSSVILVKLGASVMPGLQHDTYCPIVCVYVDSLARYKIQDILLSIYAYNYTHRPPIRLFMQNVYKNIIYTKYMIQTQQLQTVTYFIAHIMLFKTVMHAYCTVL